MEVTQNGVIYNWDNKGFVLKYDTFCKYGLNFSGNKNLGYQVNHTKKVNLTYLLSFTWG